MYDTYSLEKFIRRQTGDFTALLLEKKFWSLCTPLCIDVYAGPLLRTLSLQLLSRRFIVRGPLSPVLLKDIPWRTPWREITLGDRV